MTIDEMKDYLAGYEGRDINIMEVCGSHTAAIAKNGIPGMLSHKIHLISGPGCPVCVTPTAYVDRLIMLAEEGSIIVTFGDLIRVPGSRESLADAKGRGIRVEMVYSPFDVLPMAKKEPDREFVFAAVGFETTTPVYALLVDKLVNEGIKNVRILTAIKTMPEVISAIMDQGAAIDGFLAPGHVSAVTGSGIFDAIAEKYDIPFAVAGFSGQHLLKALCAIVMAIEKNTHSGTVFNLYPEVVTKQGNKDAIKMIDRYFEAGDALWRGIGNVSGSGKYLKDEWGGFDAGSRGLSHDEQKNKACRCASVLMGKIKPADCPLFGKVCTPLTPQGACMVSEEGSCHSYLVNG